jgi:hypothetical protein
MYSLSHSCVRGCIQKFPDWLPRVSTANGTALCHQMQLYYCYFVSQSSEFCRHNPLCCFQTDVYYRCFGYRLVLKTTADMQNFKIFFFCTAMSSKLCSLVTLYSVHMHWFVLVCLSVPVIILGTYFACPYVYSFVFSLFLSP